METGAPKLLDRVRDAIRARHYSRRTEVAYVTWIRRYIVYHRKTHPSVLGAPDISAFLTWLATERHVSASTQNQALAALLFLYERVLQIPVGPVEHVIRAKQPIRLPVVLSRQEVATVLSHLDGTMWVIGMLLYGAGLRLEECLELRVKDIDFDRSQIGVKRGKGQKDRTTTLPSVLVEALRQHLAQVRLLHEGDLKNGAGRVVCLTPWTGSIRERPRNGHGSSRFQPRASARIRVGARPLVFICTNRRFRRRLPPPLVGLGFRNASVRTPFGIRSRRICWKMVTTSAPSRNCSVTKTSVRRWCTPTCLIAGCLA